jgi:hypothetical protein
MLKRAKERGVKSLETVADISFMDWPEAFFEALTFLNYLA